MVGGIGVGVLLVVAVPAGAASAGTGQSRAVPAIAGRTGEPRSAAVRAVVVAASGEADRGVDGPLRKFAALAGYVSYGLMGASMVWGLTLTTGIAQRYIKRATVYGGHMTLTVTTLAFTALHALSYVFQVNEHFSVVDAVVPFAGEAEVALGIVGFELMAAVAFSLWVQRRLGYRRWHYLHLLAYPAFGLGLVHVFATSSEARAGGLITVALVGTAAVLVVLTVLRFLPRTRLATSRLSAAQP